MGGFCVHVTRATHWKNSSRVPIAMADIEALVTAAGDLELIRDARGIYPETGTVLFVQPVVILWLAHPSGDPVAINFDDGRLSVIDPDEAVLARLSELARTLSATVQNDLYVP